MRWVKASEQLPEMSGTYFCTVQYFYKPIGMLSKVAVAYDDLEWTLHEDNKVIEWLCEDEQPADVSNAMYKEGDVVGYTPKANAVTEQQQGKGKMSDAIKEIREIMSPYWNDVKCVCDALGRGRCELNCKEHEDNKQGLPQVEGDVEKMAMEWFKTANKHEIIFDLGWMSIFKAGYSAAHTQKGFSKEQIHALVAPLQLNGEYTVNERWASMQLKDMVLDVINSLPKQQVAGEGWIKVDDAPLFIKTELGWECTEVGDGEFWAAVPYNDKNKPDKKDLVWIRHCVVEDGTGLCVVGDDSNEPAGWQLEDVVYYIPIKLPTVPSQQ
jgi:hypothetical protein